MALATSDALAAFDQTTGALSLSPVLSVILLKDTAFLGLIGMGESVTKKDGYFNEDVLNASYVTGAESSEFTAADGTLTVDDDAILAVGCLLQDNAAGKDEIVQVTAISSNDLTVTRGYGSTSAETHSATAQWDIVGHPKQEGDETITDKSKVRTQVTIYTQIFKDTVKISGTMQAEALNGVHPGVPNELKYQLVQRTLELKVQMNMAALRSVISSSAGSDTVYRTMKGLREYLVASGANHRSTNENLSANVVNLMYKDAWSDGGDPRDLVGHADQIEKFGDMNAGKIRIAPSDRVAGVFVNKFLTSLGVELSLLVDRFMKTDEVALIDRSRVFIAPLQNRGLTVEPLAKIGDAERAQILTEVCLVCKNATLAHSYHSRLKRTT